MYRSLKRVVVMLGLVLLIVAATATAVAAKPVTVSPIEQLGAAIAFDANLSEPAGQACADCHDPRSGYGDRVRRYPVSEGVIPGLFGGRNAPSWAYTAWSPVMDFDAAEGLWIGGMFWDGRATGWTLGSPLAEQAQGPFLNPVEMHNASEAEVIRDISTSSYADLFLKVFPDTVWTDVDQAYDDMAFAIAAYESSRSVNRFNSRFDAYMAGRTGSAHGAGEAGPQALQRQGEVQPVPPERADDGLDRHRRGQGAVHRPHLRQPGHPGEPHRLGADRKRRGRPRSRRVPQRGGIREAPGRPRSASSRCRRCATSPGTGRTATTATSRTLYDIVHFYNTRDVPGAGWAPPEVPETVNKDELGDLGLTKNEELALVAFMKTLTDRAIMPQPAH